MFKSELSRAAEADDVEAVATALARDGNGSVTARALSARLDRLADELRPELEGVDPIARLGRLIHGVYKRLGFHTPTSYDEPALHLLDRVIETRRGSPVALAVVLIALGRRFSVELSGVAFPGHFMVRHDGGRHPVFIDPASGAFPFPTEALTDLAKDELRVSGEEAAKFLRPVGARTVGVRLLYNLQRAYEGRGDQGRAMLVFDRLYELTGSPLARCDRGLRAAALGAPHGAVDDLSAYLRDHVDDRVAEAMARLSPEPSDLN